MNKGSKRIYKPKSRIFNCLGIWWTIPPIIFLSGCIFIFLNFRAKPFSYIILRILENIGLTVLIFLAMYRDLRESTTTIIITDTEIKRTGWLGKDIKANWNEIKEVIEFQYGWFWEKLKLKTPYGTIHVPEILHKYNELKRIIYSKAKNAGKSYQHEGKIIVKWMAIIFSILLILLIIYLIISARIRQ